MRKVLEAVYQRCRPLQPIYRTLRVPIARSRVKRLVHSKAKASQRCRVVIGAKGKCPADWIPTEIYTLNMLVPSDWERYFKPDSIDVLLAEHVWEHLTVEDGIRAAKACHTYLRRGGYLRVAVPDGLFPDPKYIEFVRPGGSGPSADDHKVLYTYRTFSEVFEKAGFKVRLLEYFDESGEFHEQPWDPADGRIVRSKLLYQGHTFGALKYRSLILDACK